MLPAILTLPWMKPIYTTVSIPTTLWQHISFLSARRNVNWPSPTAHTRRADRKASATGRQKRRDKREGQRNGAGKRKRSTSGPELDRMTKDGRLKSKDGLRGLDLALLRLLPVEPMMKIATMTEEGHVRQRMILAGIAVGVAARTGPVDDSLRQTVLSIIPSIHVHIGRTLRLAIHIHKLGNSTFGQAVSAAIKSTHRQLRERTNRKAQDGGAYSRSRTGQNLIGHTVAAPTLSMES